MSVKNYNTERCEYNREISERNSIRESLAQMAKEIIAFIIEKVINLRKMAPDSFEWEMLSKGIFISVEFLGAFLV